MCSSSPRGLDSEMVVRERNLIRVQVAALLSAGLSIPFFEYSPDDAKVVFGDLPAGIVDWAPDTRDRWDYIDQGVRRYSYLLVGIYEPVSKGDYGKASSDAITAKLDAAEAILRHKTTLNNTVDASVIVESMVEGMAAELKGTGIKARFAWLVLEVQVMV